MIKFSTKQSTTIQTPFTDNSFIVFEGSIRSGKSTAMRFLFSKFIIQSPDSIFMILGYSQTQAYRLAIDGEGMGLEYIFPNSKVKEDKFGKHLSIKFPNSKEKRVYIMGGGDAASYKQFQGLSLGGTWLCELPLLHESAVEEALRRSIASKLRVNFADLNPPPPHHWSIDFMNRQHNLQWTHFLMTDNPIMSETRLKEVEESLKSNPYLYKRDWEGKRVQPEGLIYSGFDYDENFINVIPKDEKIIDLIYVGDYGTSDASVLIAGVITKSKYNQNNFYILDCYYYSGFHTGMQKAPSQTAYEMKTFIQNIDKKYQKLHSEVYIDPAALHFRKELELAGIHNEKANNNAHDIKGSLKGIKVGIERTQQLINTRRLKFIREGNFDPLLKEISSYSYDKETDNPIDKENHLMDSLRYFTNYVFRQYMPRS